MQRQKLPNDSFNDSFLQTPPLRDSILRWLVDWSHFHVILPVMPCFLQYMVMADKAVFVVLLCVQRYRANRYFYLQKRHQVTKTEFVFSFRPKRKHQQVGGWYANITWWHQHETVWDSFYKRLVSKIQSRLFLVRDNNFILSDLKLCRIFLFTQSCVTHCMKAH